MGDGALRVLGIRSASKVMAYCATKLVQVYKTPVKEHFVIFQGTVFTASTGYRVWPVYREHCNQKLQYRGLTVDSVALLCRHLMQTHQRQPACGSADAETVAHNGHDALCHYFSSDLVSCSRALAKACDSVCMAGIHEVSAAAFQGQDHGKVVGMHAMPCATTCATTCLLCQRDL